MNRTLAFPLVAGLALALSAAAWAASGEDFPVNHRDVITVRVLNGRNGKPLGPLHLTLIGGYDEQDLRDQFYREEVITDAHGQVQLSRQLENLPWLQVWVQKKKLCQAKPRAVSFSVDLIRRDGLSTPNHCGLATVEDAPGVFTVYVKGKRPHPPAVVVTYTQNSAPAPAPAAVPAPPPAPAHEANSCSCAGGKKMTRTAAVCNRIGVILNGAVRFLP